MLNGFSGRPPWIAPRAFSVGSPTMGASYRSTKVSPSGRGGEGLEEVGALENLEYLGCREPDVDEVYPQHGEERHEDEEDRDDGANPPPDYHPCEE